MKTTCIFLDRDGTLNKALVKHKSPNYKLRPPYKYEEFDLYEDLFYLSKFKKEFIFIIISNQPDLTNGLQSNFFQDYINREIKKKILITDFFYCKCVFDSNDKNKCKCYKPNTYMIDKAIKKFNISKSQSYLIGDTWRDIKMANLVKIKSILIDRGHFKKLKLEFIKNNAKPSYTIRSFSQLKNIIR